MQKTLITLVLVALGLMGVQAESHLDSVNHGNVGDRFKLDRSVMSDAYWKVWSDEALARIDARIEKYRKADGVFDLGGVPAGTDVTVEQLSHAFVFGANIFNFNQLGSSERNLRYKELFGTLFNSATVAFYWRNMEPYPGAVRFEETYWDSEEYWNNCKEPWKQRHWRRPPPDPVISFCKQRGIRIHGHPLTWVSAEWMLPSWIWDEYCPEEEKFALEQASGVAIPRGNWRLPMGMPERSFDWKGAWNRVFKKLSPERIAQLTPTFFARLNEFTERRIVQIAQRYGDRVDSWDVANESSLHFRGKSKTGNPFDVTPHCGAVAGDFAWRAFRVAQEHFPSNVLLNINDFARDQKYVDQIEDLIRCGAKVDVVGSQMHLFNPKESAKIAAGTIPPHMTPDGVDARFDLFSEPGRPIHLSEITITAPDLTEKGQMIQAIILNNMYRAWFSQEKMMGITWWNVVDNCGAPGEPNISGLFTRDMKPKLAYYALNQLVNEIWRTRTTVKVDDGGKVSFRGFRGKYRLTWKNAKGETQTKVEMLK